MAITGETIDNPVTHDRILFRSGTPLVFDDFLLAGHISPPEHVHPRQHERFDVISGSMGMRINGRQQVLAAGESMGVPPGTPHALWNAGQGDAHVIVELKPALFEKVRPSSPKVLCLARPVPGHAGIVKGRSSS